MDLDVGFKAVAYLLLKGVFEIASDHEDDGGEAGLEGIVDGVFDEGFAVGSEGIHLFETAVTAAHAGGHDD